MSKKKVDLSRPIRVGGGSREAKIVAKFENGGFAVVIQGENNVRQFDRYGYPTDNWPARAANEVPEITEFLSLYPDGNVYRKTCCPVSQSHYGVENLIQIKVTRRGDQIIKKEFADATDPSS